MQTPTHYVAESYQRGNAEHASARARRAAVALAGRGKAIRHVWSLSAPQEELCLHLFETSSAELVVELGREASLPFDRIWPAVPVAPDTRPSTP